MTYTVTLKLMALLVVVSLIPNTLALSLAQDHAQKLSARQNTANHVNQEITADDSKCGGVLEADSYLRQLSYKFGKPVNRNESCIWTIHAATGSVIKLGNIETYFRNFNDQQYVSLGYFNQSNYDNLNSLIWKKLSNTEGLQTIEILERVAFIHFSFTYYNPGLGFRLTYQSGGPSQSSNYTFVNYFVGGNSGIFKYPVSGGTYNNNQRITIVVKADSTLSMENHLWATTLYMRITNGGIQDSVNCTADSVNLYGLNPGGTMWYKNSTLCGLTPKRHQLYITYPRNDPVIITFKSDGDIVGEGFQFFWVDETY